MSAGALPYRPCAGIVLSRSGKVFVGQRLDSQNQAWQMPQGGIDDGETPKAAALRELGEETGVGADKVTILGESKAWICYDIPPDLITQLWGGRFRGQRQKWFFMRLDADDSVINIKTAHQEFSRWRWISPDEAVQHIVPFKRAIYRQIFDEFSAYFE